MKRFQLCRLEEVPDGGSHGFSVEIDSSLLELFLVRQADRLYAYSNSCPHTGGPLDWTPDQFLDLDGKFIQCATHDALFTIQDGRCIAGPCVGERLKALDVQLEGECVWLTV